MQSYSQVWQSKPSRLFLILGGLFIGAALLAELIGGKIFSLEDTLGIPPLAWEVLGHKLNLDLTVGVLIWPLTFILTDIINDYFGVKGVKFISYLVVSVILLAFGLILLAIAVSPSEFYRHSRVGSGIPDMDIAFTYIFGQSTAIILGSIIAFIVAQFLDAYVFKKIKKATGGKKKWLRATLSTVVSQLIDSFVVLFIAFYIGSRIQATEGDFIWPFSLVIAVGFINFLYKTTAAILLIPLLYAIHHLIERYLGTTLSTSLLKEAVES